MRLVCPNCDAQYELAKGAISDAGRDVQCSNCGHTWFQLPPEIEAEREDDEDRFSRSVPVVRPVAPLPVVASSATKASTKNPLGAYVKASRPARNPEIGQREDDERHGVAAAASAKLAEATAKNSNAAAERRNNAAALAAAMNDEASSQRFSDEGQAEGAAPAAADHPAADVQAQPFAAQRRPLDDNLKAVLREEAEREASVRRSQTPRSLETQPDLGLQETAGGAGAAKAVRDRLARLRGQEAEPEANDKPAARRDLLPDIEEINSTLRASSENRRRVEAAVAEGEGGIEAPNTGFRSGFSLMLLIAVVAIAAYVGAPKIIEQFPAAEGAMIRYVTGVDAARAWLDNSMRSAIAALQNLTSGTKN